MATDLQQAMGHDLRTEYHKNSGCEAFMGMAHYPAYVQWLESELRSARQKINEAEQTIHQQANYSISRECKTCIRRGVENFCGTCDTGYSNWKSR